MDDLGRAKVQRMSRVFYNCELTMQTVVAFHVRQTRVGPRRMRPAILCEVAPLGLLDASGSQGRLPAR